MSFPPVPAEGNIEIHLSEGWIDNANNGEQRILARETGLPFQKLGAVLRTEDGESVDIAEVDAFDMADFLFAAGRIGLRQQYGVAADTPENAERVKITFTAPAAAAGDTLDPTNGVAD